MFINASVMKKKSRYTFILGNTLGVMSLTTFLGWGFCCGQVMQMNPQEHFQRFTAMATICIN